MHNVCKYRLLLLLLLVLLMIHDLSLQAEKNLSEEQEAKQEIKRRLSRKVDLPHI